MKIGLRRHLGLLWVYINNFIWRISFTVIELSPFFILCYVYQPGCSLRISFFTWPDDILVTLKSVQRRVSFVFWVFYKCEDCENREEYFIKVLNVDNNVILRFLQFQSRQVQQRFWWTVFISRISISRCVKYECVRFKMISSLIFGITELSRSNLSFDQFRALLRKVFHVLLEHRRGMKCDEIKEFRRNVEQNVK